MPNLFHYLEKLGFKNLDNVDIFKKEEKVVKTAGEKVVTEINPEDFLYDKSVECPVCEQSFKERTVKKGKVRLVSTDASLRSTYEPIDPLYYDIILCPHCGYAAVSSLFEKVSQTQIDIIKKEITPKFKKIEYPSIFDVNIAIQRYQLALLNCVIKKAKNSEKAYVCMKLAWLCKESKDTEKEKTYIQNAYMGFKQAYSSERFPLFGIDEYTLAYIMSDLSQKIGDNSEALRWLGIVLTSRTANARLKDRALEQKNLIKNSN